MRGLHIFFTGMIFFLPFFMHAQDLELGGSAEARHTFLFAEDDPILSDVETFRLKAVRKMENSSIEAVMLYSTGLKSLDPSQSFRPGSVMDSAFQDLLTDSNFIISQLFTDSTTSQFIPVLERLYYSSLFPKDQLTMERMVLKLYFKKFDLYAGKQTIAWGTGYGWNPTDIWNVKNPLDPSAPRLGLNALRVQIPLGQLSEYDMVYAPGADFEHTSFGMRAKSNLGGYDFSFSGARLMNHDREVYGLPKKLMLGFDLAGEVIFDIGIWIEASFNNRYTNDGDIFSFDTTFAMADVGLDYTFTSGYYLSLEYFYNGLGEASYRDYDSQSVLYLLSGEMSGLGQNYLMLGIMKDFLSSYNGRLYSMLNLTDVSAVVIPNITYNYSDDISLQLGTNIFIGNKEKSEFGSFYSSSFLKVEGYF